LNRCRGYKVNSRARKKGIDEEEQKKRLEGDSKSKKKREVVVPVYFSILFY
jgi:hypothetical protein